MTATEVREAVDAADARAQAADEAAVPDLAAKAVRDATLELMKHGVVEEARKPNVYRTLRTGAEATGRILAPLDLELRIDEIRGLAFLAVAASAVQEEGDEWSHPLVRRQRLTLEQSLLVAILRQQFVAFEQEAGVGAAEALVALDDLLPHLQMYLGDPGSESQEKRRLLTLLEQIKGHGLVSDIDANERVSIRPLIVHVANPENLQSLIHALRQMADPARDGEAR